EVGEHAGRPYFALEYLDGGNLTQRLAGTPQPSRRAAELVELLARTMHHAHETGFVHRDLKPANILLRRKKGGRARSEIRISKSETNPKFEITKSETGTSAASSLGHSNFEFVSDFEFRISDFEPKIGDFGLVKLLDAVAPSGSGPIFGTPGYMAPEQASGKSRQIAPATDVYSLGAILLELLPGRAPFRGEPPLAALARVLHAEPVPPRRLHPKVPRDLELICLKCLSKDPAKRYAGADALADDLRRFLDGRPIEAR